MGTQDAVALLSTHLVTPVRNKLLIRLVGIQGKRGHQRLHYLGYLSLGLRQLHIHGEVTPREAERNHIFGSVEFRNQLQLLEPLYH
ncbi:hypothetical protein Pmani_012237 [Petrolisthes manimaculis]|uniref:Uncharacterized protein n=1 Tax=Petrolisthes manimaculis TaxID=1843537 RepID=A0AAE1PZL9_9EUCA|nr:hypothetical protein Pmani_012237 [Petrolisthes manimaculis]